MRGIGGALRLHEASGRRKRTSRRRAENQTWEAAAKERRSKKAANGELVADDESAAGEKDPDRDEALEGLSGVTMAGSRLAQAVHQRGRQCRDGESRSATEGEERVHAASLAGPHFALAAETIEVAAASEVGLAPNFSAWRLCQGPSARDVGSEHAVIQLIPSVQHRDGDKLPDRLIQGAPRLSSSSMDAQAVVIQTSQTSNTTCSSYSITY